MLVVWRRVWGRWDFISAWRRAFFHSFLLFGTKFDTIFSCLGRAFWPAELSSSLSFRILEGQEFFSFFFLRFMRYESLLLGELDSEDGDVVGGNNMSNRDGQRMGWLAEGIVIRGMGCDMGYGIYSLGLGFGLWQHGKIGGGGGGGIRGRRGGKKGENGIWCFFVLSFFLFAIHCFASRHSLFVYWGVQLVFFLRFSGGYFVLYILNFMVYMCAFFFCTLFSLSLWVASRLVI